MSETSLAESAQAIFCSIADNLGPGMDKVLDTEKYPTFTDFESANKIEINNALKYIDVDEKYKGVVAQLVRVSACHAECRGFESLRSRHYK